MSISVSDLDGRRDGSGWQRMALAGVSGSDGEVRLLPIFPVGLARVQVDRWQRGFRLEVVVLTEDDGGCRGKQDSACSRVKCG